MKVLNYSYNTYNQYNRHQIKKNNKPTFGSYSCTIPEGLLQLSRGRDVCYCYEPSKSARQLMRVEKSAIEADLGHIINSPEEQTKEARKNLSYNDKSRLEVYKEIIKSPDIYMAKLDEKHAEEIFGRSKEFGIKEYENLSDVELDLLRRVTDKAFEDYDSCFGFANFLYQMNRSIRIGKAFSERLDELYPNGYTFVSVGRSPSLLGKYLEFQGKDVKYIPISSLQNVEKFPKKVIANYKDYLDSIGLTKEFVEKTDKPIIITDFIDTGATMRNFEKLLACSRIGIHASEKVIFSPMNYFHRTLSGKLEKPIIHMDDKVYPKSDMRYTIESGMSCYNDLYSPIPYWRALTDCSLVEEMKTHEQSLECKKMLFCLIDYIKSKSQS